MSTRWRIVRGPSPRLAYDGYRVERMGWFGWRCIDWFPSEHDAQRYLDHRLGILKYGDVVREETR